MLNQIPETIMQEEGAITSRWGPNAYPAEVIRFPFPFEIRSLKSEDTSFGAAIPNKTSEERATNSTPQNLNMNYRPENKAESRRNLGKTMVNEMI